MALGSPKSAKMAVINARAAAQRMGGACVTGAVAADICGECTGGSGATG